jgi:hypothetical protein
MDQLLVLHTLLTLEQSNYQSFNGDFSLLQHLFLGLLDQLLTLLLLECVDLNQPILVLEVLLDRESVALGEVLGIGLFNQ